MRESGLRIHFTGKKGQGTGLRAVLSPREPRAGTKGTRVPGWRQSRARHFSSPGLSFSCSSLTACSPPSSRVPGPSGTGEDAKRRHQAPRVTPGDRFPPLAPKTCPGGAFGTTADLRLQVLPPAQAPWLPKRHPFSKSPSNAPSSRKSPRQPFPERPSPPPHPACCLGRTDHTRLSPQAQCRLSCPVHHLPGFPESFATAFKDDKSEEARVC